MKNQKITGTGRRILRLLIGVIVLFALIAGGFLILPLTESVDRTKVEGSESWMADITDDLSLSSIWLPGTHNSAAQYAQMAYFSRCQSLSIREQLDAGFRYLDIRLGTDDSEELSLMHEAVSCRTGIFGSRLLITDVLRDCYAFLQDHPTETIVFAAAYEHGDRSVAEVEKMLDAVIREKEGSWLLTDTIPSLGEARGKLVLFRRYEDEAGLGTRSGIPFLWETRQDGGKDQAAVVRQENGSYTLLVQDCFAYNVTEKWAAFVSGLEQPVEENELSLNFLSTKGTAAYGHPYTFAEKLNRRLLDNDLTGTDGARWIVVDFGSGVLAEHIRVLNPAT